MNWNSNCFIISINAFVLAQESNFISSFLDVHLTPVPGRSWCVCVCVWLRWSPQCKHTALLTPCENPTKWKGHSSASTFPRSLVLLCWALLCSLCPTYSRKLCLTRSAIKPHIAVTTYLMQANSGDVRCDVSRSESFQYSVCQCFCSSREELHRQFGEAKRSSAYGVCPLDWYIRCHHKWLVVTLVCSLRTVIPPAVTRE